MTYNSASRSHVHQCITCCSSNLLSWDWCHLKAEMILFNIDVHHLYWFILEIYEKCPRSWLKKSAKHLEFFLSPKVPFAFSLIFKDLQLKNHEELNSNYVETIEVDRLIYHLSIGSVILVAWATSYGLPKWATWPFLAHFQ